MKIVRSSLLALGLVIIFCLAHGSASAANWICTTNIAVILGDEPEAVYDEAPFPDAEQYTYDDTGEDDGYTEDLDEDTEPAPDFEEDTDPGVEDTDPAPNPEETVEE